MSQILFAWELGVGDGHCIKLVPIAKKCVHEGHTVIVAARNLATAKRHFDGLQVSWFQAPFLADDPQNPIRWPRTMAQALQNIGFGCETDLTVLTAAWRSLFAAAEPDLVAYDHSPTALLASRWHGHRRVIVGTGFELPPRNQPLPELEYWREDKSDPDDIDAKEAAVLDRANQLLQRDGLQPLKCLADLYAEVDLSCLLTFAELDHYPNRTGATYWGAWSPTGGLVPEWPTFPGPRVFAYLKPPRTNWELGGFLSFVRAQRMATLMYIPGGDQEWLKRFETPALRFVYEPVDIHRVAEECDAAILNGNAGSVAEFLLRGVPLLNIPLYMEQSMMSHRVADLGAGVIATPRDPEHMANQLMELLGNPKYRTAAQSFAQKYADFDPNRAIDEVAGKILSLL